jgi:hypothetical protein
MFHLFLYASTGYFLIGAAIYTFGHPRLRQSLHTLIGNEGEGGNYKPPKDAKSGLVYRHLGHSAQAANFVFSKTSISTIIPRRHKNIRDAYISSVRQAFDPKKQSFITTGSPHARAYYLRNFAWFYPTLLDPATIIDDSDRKNRIQLLAQSIETILSTTGAEPYPTTLIPIGNNTMSAVNYVVPPSDSLLGVLVGIEQLLDGAPQEGARLLACHKDDLRTQTEYLLSELREIELNDIRCALLDIDEDRSSATDTRRERMRFVVAANIWTTFDKATRLGLINEKRIRERLGCGLAEYKRRILTLFGADGYIKNSLDPSLSACDADAITLDFAHIHNGFWTFSSQEEISLFKATADKILDDPHFADESGDAFFVALNPTHHGLIHRLTVPNYQGRSVWPNFNVAFAERLLALTAATGDNVYRDRAERILLRIKFVTEKNGGYPELLNAHGGLYRTWIYRSAIANSWFPYFVTVWHETFKCGTIGE